MGAPVLLTQVALVVDEGGNALYQPAYHSQPAAAEDITDELFAALQQQLAAAGLAASRMPPSVPTPAPVTRRRGQRMRQARIVSDNAADRALLAVPGTAAGLGVAHLKRHLKGQVGRVLGDVATITATWPQDEDVACVVLPACSLGADAKVRVQVFDASDVLVIDTGERWAVPGTTLGNWDFTQPLNVNAFSEGAAICQVWFEPVASRRVVITLSDPGAAFIDLARLVIDPTLRPSMAPTLVPSAPWTWPRPAALPGDLRTDWAPGGRSALQSDLSRSSSVTVPACDSCCLAARAAGCL